VAWVIDMGANINQKNYEGQVRAFYVYMCMYVYVCMCITGSAGSRNSEWISARHLVIKS